MNLKSGSGLSEQPIDSINIAIAMLGTPKIVWLRGHVKEHCLLPSLFRFPEGVEKETLIAERFRNHRPASDEMPSDDAFEILLAMHHSYVPTRLLAWTEKLKVALFCALVRETDQPAIFVLDPIKLNMASNIGGIVQPNSQASQASPLCEWPNEQSLPEHPIAIDGNSLTCDLPVTETLFTVHGRNKMPLEQQCPDCVKKVELSDEEKLKAMRYILSGR